MTIDGSEVNASAIQGYNAEHGTTIAIRQVRYLNDMVEQEHRAVKCIARPAISVPCGMSQGLPVGMVLVGRYGEDAAVLRAAHAFEQLARR
jgi:Asp-tRNA(Asn)/Glu-tRNA(Gln) amidotransferase A subunit family amidase